ncbi:MAG: lamin tail domain-containing protein, partial [Anaerolineales bacterium]|nr:lamin tail domain-containing protein [Anaerolineales bacterium]
GQTYNKTNGIWTVGTVLNGESKYLDITTKLTSYGIRTNYAQVWKSDQSDPNSDPGDDSTIEDDDDSAIITSKRTVILNEIAWGGTGASSEDEWIELYNPSDSSITITGWKIRKNSCGSSGTDYISLSGSVSKGGYFLLERGSTTTDNTTVSNVSANQIYLAASVPALLDTGETLYLCDNFGNFIDTANLEGFGNPSNPWPAGSGSTSPPRSMERQGTSEEEDDVWVSNTGTLKNGEDASGNDIYGTPGRSNSTGSAPTPTPTAIPTSTVPPAPIPPRPIINEILARPGFDWNQDGEMNVFDEFIEIKNLTAVAISLKGWKLSTVDGSSFTLPDVTLAPNERVVFYGKETNILLSDGGETVRLSNSSGKIYDAFTYDIARTEDRSFCRLPDGNPGNSWFDDCIPTPKLANTREGKSPIAPDEEMSPVCNLPDTVPLAFFIAECNGYGANIWDPYYWDMLSGAFKIWIEDKGKWNTFIE